MKRMAILFMRVKNERSGSMKSKRFLFGLLVLGVIVGVLDGCGQAIYDEIAYYDPNWLTDGRIMAVKSVIKHRSEGIPGYGRDVTVSSAQYIVSMRDDGSDERSIYGGEGRSFNIPVASPLGSYIAYASGHYINIISADGTMEIKTLDIVESPQSMDWSPDETRIAFSGYDTKDLGVLTISSGVITKIATNAGEVAWRIGDKISFGYLYVIDSDGNNSNYLADGGKPQNMNSGKILYYADLITPGNYVIKSVYPSGSSEGAVLSSYDKSSLKLSFDNMRVAGGDLGQRSIKGIWVVNIDGTNLRKIRD
jgi:hypothetical protein